MSQVIDLASNASQIDAGELTYTLSGWLEGFGDYNDNARVLATFRGSSGSALGTASIGPVFEAESQYKAGLLLETASGAVPTGRVRSSSERSSPGPGGAPTTGTRITCR